MQNTVADTLLRTEELSWLNLGPGVDYKVLRISAETGMFVMILRAKAGSAIPPHRHLGAGEYYVIKGRVKYRAGEAKTGDYGYEPLGVYHENTQFVEDTELFFTGYGPIAFLGPKGEIAQLLDWEFLRAQMAQ